MVVIETGSGQRGWMRRRGSGRDAARAMDTISDVPAVTGRRWGMLDAAPAGGPADYSLHTDTEAICPRCLRWIAPEDFLRRNSFGLLQHETCPPQHLRPLPVPLV